MTMRHTQSGLSLIELMVTLFIVAIALSIGGPQFSQFIANNRMAAAINEMNISLHLGRTEAIKRNAFVSICPSPNWDAVNPGCDPTASFSAGWIVFIDADNDGAPNLQIDANDTVLQSHGPMNEDIDLLAGDNGGLIGGDKFVIFQPSGYPMNALNGSPATFHLQLCDDRGAKDTGAGISAGRWINIAPTGRPQMHRSTNAVESANNPLGGCSYKG
jgi:prepilin-type N-terminal cleavage/methylation domain-containing protein